VLLAYLSIKATLRIYTEWNRS